MVQVPENSEFANARLLSRLAALVGDLMPVPSGSAADLSELHRLAVQVVLRGDDEAQQLPTTSTSPETEALAPLLDQVIDPDNAFLISRRELPILSTQHENSLPRWASGRTIERTLGPFRDRLGRDIWFDVFRIVRQVRLVRSTGGAPFITLPLSLFARVLPRPTPSHYDLPAGSVWINSGLFTATAPASAYTGLRIRGGRLEFTQPVAITGDEVVVPASVHCHVDLDFEPIAPPPGSGEGGDARAAEADTPKRATLHIGAGGATFSSVEPARLQAYGTSVGLTHAPGTITYLPDVNRLAVPLRSDVGDFEVRSVTSRLFLPTGRANILGAAWGLPVAVINPANLGEASGSGNLLLWLDRGIHATWLDQPKHVALGASLLMVDAARLVLLALMAGSQGAQQLVALWEGAGPNTALLRFGQRFALRFFAQASGSEALWASATLAATVDRPVDVNGDRLALRSNKAQAILIAGPQGAFVLIVAELDAPYAVKQVGLAIKNALFVTAPPNLAWIYTGLDASNRDTGGCVLAFRQQALVPTLPDPYAANIGALRAVLDQPAGALLALVTWWPVGQIKLDFLLPAGSGLVAAAGPAAAASLMSGGIESISPRAIIAAGNSEVVAGAAKALGDALAFERQRSLILVDVSSNSDQFGVAVGTHGREIAAAGLGPGLAVQDLYLQASNFLILTLPAVQWEAVITESDPNDPTFPQRLGFANSGVPTIITVPSVRLVPIHPRAALDALVDNFASPNPLPARARFTLPFGMIASAILDKPSTTSSRGADIEYNRPKTADLEGGHQISIRAVDTALSPDESPSLKGYTAQMPVGQPGFRSVLGNQVTVTFNSYLGAGGFRELVPVERFDLSGYGESLFSDWRNPYPDPVAVSQARFDVIVGRTAHEVVQVRSYLYPYAVQVVRTITIERKNNAIVNRRDSGWQAVSDGVYTFPGFPTVETHPGIVRRITKVTSIRDTGEILTIDSVQLAAVRFDGDLEMDGAAGLVPTRDQLGYVQLSAGNLMAAATYEKLVQTAGPLGGAIDANLNIGGGGQAMRVHRVGVGVTQGMGGPEFAMAAWGSPQFPGGGEWSFLQLMDPDQAPVAVPRDGVPLIRAGTASSGDPPLSSPYRFANPVDLAHPDNPDSDYGIIHATGTQRVFFSRPKIEASDTSRITSTRTPALADPYSLATSLGLFPEIPKAIPFPSANWAFRIGADGNYKLELPTNTFPITVGRRTLRQAGSVKGDIDYTGATITYELDTAQAVPWRFALEGASKVMNSTLMGDVITLSANVRASADRPSTFTEPRLKLGGSLSVVQDLLTILEDVGITGIMRVDMTNEWSIAVGVTVPFKDPAGDDLQIPPLVPIPDIKFADTGASVEVKVWPQGDEAGFSFGGQPMFAIKSVPGLYVVAIIEFGIKLSTETGTTYSLTLGVGIAYEIEAGPFELKGLFALTFFGFIGDTTIGFGVGFLIKVSVELVIIEIAISLEGKLALVWACRGTPTETLYGAAKLVFAIEVTIGFIFSIGIEFETTAERVLQGPDPSPCALPEVIP